MLSNNIKSQIHSSITNPKPKPTIYSNPSSIASITAFSHKNNHKQSGYSNNNHQTFNKSNILYGGAFAAALAGVYEKTNEWKYGKDKNKKPEIPNLT